MKHYEMRRAARRMNDSAVRDLLERGSYCVVSCIDENGLPYGVPLSYVYEADSTHCPVEQALASEPPAADACAAESTAACSTPGRDASNPARTDAASCTEAAKDMAMNPDAPHSFGTLYFHTTDQGGRKMDAFLADGRVCATVVEDVAARFENAAFTTGFSSAMAFGRIRRVTDAVVVRKALVNLCMKYLPEHKDGIGAAMDADLATTAVWALDIEELSGKQN